MATFWERQGRRAGNAVSNNVIDPMRSAGRGTVNAAGNAWNAATGLYDKVSGAGAAGKATNQQLQGVQQGMDASRRGTEGAQGYLAPYNNPQDYQDLRSLVKGGSFDTQRGAYAPPTYQSPGQFQPPTTKSQWQSHLGGAFDENAWNKSNGGVADRATTDKLGSFGMQGFNSAMPTAPQRQAATAENVNMYMDPGYQFRLEQGLKGLTNSASTMGSGSTLKALMGYNQGLASQEFGNAYNRFQDTQDMARSDYKDDRNFTADEIERMYGRATGDRSFQRGVYQDDRNFGRDSFESDRDFGRRGYEWDTSMDRLLDSDRYGRLSDLAGTSRDTARDQSKYAYQGGRDEADYFTDMADIRAGGTLAKSKARRGLAGDAIEFVSRNAEKLAGRG